MAHAELPIPPDLAVDTPPMTDDDLAAYFAVMDAGPNAELVNGPDHVDPDHAAAIEDAAHVHGWRVEADDQAEWAMRKLALAQSELRVMVEQRDEYVARIDQWLDRTSRQTRRTIAYMTERLEDYGVRRRDAGGAATLSLPSGVVKTSKAEPKVEVLDDEQLAIHVQSLIEVELAMPTGDPERPTPWADAYRAAGIESLDDLVRWNPKVYVGPLRKLAAVADRRAGTTITTTLACGHTLVHTTNAVDDDGDHAVGELVPCSLCPHDPIDGPQDQPVASVDAVPLTELVAVGPDGEPLPGAGVDLGGITPKVVPGG